MSAAWPARRVVAILALAAVYYGALWAGLVVVPRPGVMLWTAERLATALGVDVAAVRLQFVACPMIEIASRELRRAIADGMSIRYMVPRAVEEYIRDRKLYAAR